MKQTKRIIKKKSFAYSRDDQVEKRQNEEKDGCSEKKRHIEKEGEKGKAEGEEKEAYYYFYEYYAKKKTNPQLPEPSPLFVDVNTSPRRRRSQPRKLSENKNNNNNKNSNNNNNIKIAEEERKMTEGTASTLREATLNHRAASDNDNNSNNKNNKFKRETREEKDTASEQLLHTNDDSTHRNNNKSLTTFTSTTATAAAKLAPQDHPHPFKKKEKNEEALEIALPEKERSVSSSSNISSTSPSTSAFRAPSSDFDFDSDHNSSSRNGHSGSRERSSNNNNNNNNGIQKHPVISPMRKENTFNIKAEEIAKSPSPPSPQYDSTTGTYTHNYDNRKRPSLISPSRGSDDDNDDKEKLLKNNNNDNYIFNSNRDRSSNGKTRRRTSPRVHDWNKSYRNTSHNDNEVNNNNNSSSNKNNNDNNKYTYRNNKDTSATTVSSSPKDVQRTLPLNHNINNNIINHDHELNTSEESEMTVSLREQIAAAKAKLHENEESFKDELFVLHKQAGKENKQIQLNIDAQKEKLALEKKKLQSELAECKKSNDRHQSCNDYRLYDKMKRNHTEMESARQQLMEQIYNQTESCFAMLLRNDKNNNNNDNNNNNIILKEEIKQKLTAYVRAVTYKNAIETAVKVMSIENAKLQTQLAAEKKKHHLDENNKKGTRSMRAFRQVVRLRAAGAGGLFSWTPQTTLNENDNKINTDNNNKKRFIFGDDGYTIEAIPDKPKQIVEEEDDNDDEGPHALRKLKFSSFYLNHPLGMGSGRRRKRFHFDAVYIPSPSPSASSSFSVPAAITQRGEENGLHQRLHLQQPAAAAASQQAEIFHRKCRPLLERFFTPTSTPASTRKSKTLLMAGVGPAKGGKTYTLLGPLLFSFPLASDASEAASASPPCSGNAEKKSGEAKKTGSTDSDSDSDISFVFEGVQELLPTELLFGNQSISTNEVEMPTKRGGNAEPLVAAPTNASGHGNDNNDHALHLHKRWNAIQSFYKNKEAEHQRNKKSRSASVLAEEEGMVMRTVEWLLQVQQEQQQSRSTLSAAATITISNISIAVYEVYMDEVYDLLLPGDAEAEMRERVTQLVQTTAKKEKQTKNKNEETNNNNNNNNNKADENAKEEKVSSIRGNHKPLNLSPMDFGYGKKNFGYNPLQLHKLSFQLRNSGDGSDGENTNKKGTAATDGTKLNTNAVVDWTLNPTKTKINNLNDAKRTLQTALQRRNLNHYNAHNYTAYHSHLHRHPHGSPFNDNGNNNNNSCDNHYRNQQRKSHLIIEVFIDCEEVRTGSSDSENNITDLVATKHMLSKELATRGEGISPVFTSSSITANRGRTNGSYNINSNNNKTEMKIMFCDLVGCEHPQLSQPHSRQQDKRGVHACASMNAKNSDIVKEVQRQKEKEHQWIHKSTNAFKRLLETICYNMNHRSNRGDKHVQQRMTPFEEEDNLLAQFDSYNNIYIHTRGTHPNDTQKQQQQTSLFNSISFSSSAPILFSHEAAATTDSAGCFSISRKVESALQKRERDVRESETARPAPLVSFASSYHLFQANVLTRVLAPYLLSFTCSSSSAAATIGAGASSFVLLLDCVYPCAVEEAALPPPLLPSARRSNAHLGGKKNKENGGGAKTKSKYAKQYAAASCLFRQQAPFFYTELLSSFLFLSKTKINT